MILAHLQEGNVKKLNEYRRRRTRFPMKLEEPATELEQQFELLKSTLEKPSARIRPKLSWISEHTWSIVDRRAALRKSGFLTKVLQRRLKREINASLKKDRANRALKAGNDIEAELAKGDMKEAWGIAKRWYRQASDTPPKPCYDSLEDQTVEREELYAERTSPGDLIPINVEPYVIQDGTPTESEIASVVRGKLRNGRAGGASGLKAEHIKGWLRGADEEDKGLAGSEGKGDTWRQFVKLIQAIWESGEIP